MSHALRREERPAAPPRRGIWPVWLVLAVLALLVLVSASAGWHSREVSLQRYCDEPEVALDRLEALHSGADPLLAESRRHYMVAAKLEFLLPRASGESDRAYRLRLRDELRRHCRSSGAFGPKFPNSLDTLMYINSFASNRRMQAIYCSFTG